MSMNEEYNITITQKSIGRYGRKKNKNPWDAYNYTPKEIATMNRLIDKYSPEILSPKQKKRKLSVSIKEPDDKNKKAKEEPNDTIFGWVSATKTKNFLLDDQSVDWLAQYYNKYGISDTPKIQQKIQPKRKYTKKVSKNRTSELLKDATHIELLFEGGNMFERKIFEELAKIHGKNFVIVMNNKDIEKYRENTSTTAYIREKNNIVRDLMNRGVPIIAQAPMINEMNKSYGMADILIRSDYLEVMFDTFTPDTEIYYSAPLLKMQKNKTYHYRVVDCKWTTMTLCVDGVTIRNEGLMPAYKGQLAVYTAALKSLQGYVPNYAYIMSKAWKIGKNTIDPSEQHLYIGYSAFDRPGVIDYRGKDNNYLALTKQAIQWVQRVVTEGNDWRYGELKPTVPEMYPNINKSINPAFDKIKHVLAMRYGDPTLVWYVNSKNRKIAHSNNIYDIRDPKCTIETLGVPRDRRGTVIENIININKHNQNKDIIRPAKIRNNLLGWKKKHTTEYYVDFETINYNLYHSPEDIDLDISYIDSDVTFMIGIGFEHNKSIDSNNVMSDIKINTTQCNYHVNIVDEWEYVCFYMTNFQVNNESELYRVFYEFILSRQRLSGTRLSKLFHWTNAEPRFMQRADDRMLKIKNKELHKIINAFDLKTQWIDMYKVFESEPIVIKGSYRYKLKHIANAFYNNGLIPTIWKDGKVSDGLKAMIEAIRLYRHIDTINIDNSIYKDIIDYNEIDCKVIYDIVGYLRDNHC